MRPTPPSTAERPPDTGSGSFYDHWTELFVRGFGPILQAGIIATGDPAREDPENSVLALAARAGVQAGDRILDAGCGVAGPAVVIATHYRDVTIDGLTNSGRQAALAREIIAASDLGARVRAVVGDYEQLPFRSRSFDQVLFFESTGYAHDLQVLYDEAFRVLRPGGRSYTKDVFRRSGPLRETELRQLADFDRLWGGHHSRTIQQSVRAMRRAGFSVMSWGPLTGIGTRRLLGSMVELDRVGGVGPSELGRSFLKAGLDPPIVFGEIRAVKAA